MKAALGVARLALLLLLSLAEGAVARNLTVAAYLPEWRYEGANWEDISETVTQLILFSMEVQPTGRLAAHDRLPRKELMLAAREATRRTGTQLLVCIGGNGRSAGFQQAVAKKDRRQRFVESLVELIEKHDLDGVDLNWEYPGYDFRAGYHSEEAVQQDYKGLKALIKRLHAALAPSGKVVTLAYYPDGKQEKLLREHGIPEYVANMHMMSYDRPGKHSTLEFAQKVAAQGAQILPAAQLTLGVPFYGRHVRSGEWKSYEDLVQAHTALQTATGDVDEVAGYYLNGRQTIATKVRLAREQGLGGVMIWEVGQDCRVHAVTHGDKTHGVTCPHGAASSLLVALREAAREGSESTAPPVHDEV